LSSKRKEHAIHNESLCDHLRDNGKFNDWVITTAFYSAVNLVKHQIFPFTENRREYDDFEEYYLYLKDNAVNISKHSAILSIVKKKLPSAYVPYKMLFDDCNMARYHDFNVSESQAKTARINLSKLNGVCTKP
jgi:hypothetical protein